MAEVTCLSCGKVLSEEWASREDLIVPLCPECHEKLAKSLEGVPPPEQFKERCNLK